MCIELLAERDKLGPESPLVKGLGRAQLHRAVAPAALAEGLESVAPAERDEQFALPWIWQSVEELLVLLTPAQLRIRGQLSSDVISAG